MKWEYFKLYNEDPCFLRRREFTSSYWVYDKQYENWERIGKWDFNKKDLVSITKDEVFLEMI